MMKFRSLALWLACAGQFAALCAPAAAQGLRPSPQLGPSASRGSVQLADGPRPADFIVAIVNSEPITNNEVRTRLLRYEQQLAQQGSPMPPRQQLTREVLERLIGERAQLQVARETGVKADEATVDNAEQNVARQNNIDVPEMRRRLRADGLDLAAFREELRNQLLLQRLRERELQSRVKVTEQDIDAYLREQQAGSAAAPQEVNLAHILVAAPEGATEAQLAPLQAKARALLQRARAGEDFGKLARENSDASGAAANGGAVGLRSADRYPPLFIDATRSLPVGGVSDIVRSEAGFHIVKVLDRRAASVPGISVTQQHARHILLRPDGALTEAAARQKLADFRRRIVAGQADFAQLARENSNDASARNGGDLGWSSPGMFVPEFEEVLEGLTPGQIAEPMVSRFGVHLIQLMERRESTLGQKEQRDVVRNLVREKKLDEAYVTWAQEVRGRAYVELREPPQ
jgi:peptidyl-prolyl cis-trans isomerase SurA